MADRVYRRLGRHLRRHNIAYAVVALAVSTFPAPSVAADLVTTADIANGAAPARADQGAGGGTRCQLRFTGGPDDDTIHGNRRDNVISGWGGHDALFGDRGDDVVRGASGQDSLNGGEGRDVLRGGSGDDSLEGSFGRDTMYGGAGSDGISGAARPDYISGGDGNDGITGGSGDDILIGGDGNDSIAGKRGDDIVRGGPGDDIIDLRHRDRFDTKDSATCGDGIDIVYIDAGGDGHGGRDTVSADCETVVEN